MPIFPKRKTTRWIYQVAKQYNKKIGTITFIFCSEDIILKMNNQYLKHDYYTDIITFDYSNENIISGDLFVSVETVKSNATKFNEPYIKEIYRVMIHGILHLCGAKDDTPISKIEMKQLENNALNQWTI